MEMMTSQNLKKMERIGVTYHVFPCLGFWNTYPKKNGKIASVKVGRVFPIVIWPEFHMWQHRVDDYREDALHFRRCSVTLHPGLAVFGTDFLTSGRRGAVLPGTPYI